MKPLEDGDKYDENIHGIRPYYGALNIYSDIGGGASAFGSSYIKLP